jgi:hypothetical protein
MGAIGMIDVEMRREVAIRRGRGKVIGKARATEIMSVEV